MKQGERLALFSERVRASSIKRFHLVRPEDRAWRPAEGRLSFVDHLKHLVDCDHWILAVVRGAAEPCADILPGEGKSEQWEYYLSELERMGSIKAGFIKSLSDEELDRRVEKPAHLGRPDVGSLILRENLEHEAQHRGTLQVLLRLKYG